MTHNLKRVEEEEFGEKELENLRNTHKHTYVRTLICKITKVKWQKYVAREYTYSTIPRRVTICAKCFQNKNALPGQAGYNGRIVVGTAVGFASPICTYVSEEAEAAAAASKCT